MARAHNLVARDRQRLDPRLDRDLDLVAPVKRVEEPRLAGVGERDEPEGVGRLVVGGKALPDEKENMEELKRREEKFKNEELPLMETLKIV